MRYGRGAPSKGMLPVFSVGSEAEAERLLTIACARGYGGDFIARELAEVQSIERLGMFGERLAELHDRYLKGTERCECPEQR